jgi:hypothetical protein
LPPQAFDVEYAYLVGLGDLPQVLPEHVALLQASEGQAVCVATLQPPLVEHVTLFRLLQ